MSEIKTRNVQSFDTIAKMTRAAFGCDISEDTVSELSGGLCNIVYCVTLPDETKTVLKIAPRNEENCLAYEHNMLQDEVWAMRLIAEKTTVKLPKVLFYDDSCSICNSPYFFMEFIDGKNLMSVDSELSEEQKDEIYKTIANWAKQMNAITGDFYGYPFIPELRAPSNEEFIVKYTKLLFEDARRVNSNLEHIGINELENLLLSQTSVMNTASKPSFIHWDLWAGNMIIRDGKIIGIIDFERALFCDYLFEDMFSGPGWVRDEFFKAYGKTEFSRDEKLRKSYYRILRCVVAITEYYYRQPDNDWQGDWNRGILKEELENFRSLMY